MSASAVYAGGQFASVGGVTRYNIAAVDARTGNVDTTWDPGASGTVRALSLAGSTLYVGGEFSWLGAARPTRHNLGAVDATSGAVTTFNPNADKPVRTLAASGSAVFVGGEFNLIGGQPRNFIAAIDPSTGLATGWNPNADFPVSALAVSGSTVYAGGGFGQVGGQTRNYIAALDAATGAATPFNPNAGGAVQALAVSGATVYAGGTFTSIGGQARNRIAALDATTGNASAWNPNAGGAVNALAVLDTTVYAGGSFMTMGCVARHRLAALDTATGSPSAWDPDAEAEVLALAAWTPASVYAGGTFTQIGRDLRVGFAAFDAAADTVTAVACVPGTVVLGTSTTCTATVTDTSTSAKTTPTGAADFSADGNGGTFSSGASCALSATGTSGQSACALNYTPGPFDVGARTVTARYGGDAAHAPSSGTAPVTVISGPPSNVSAPTISGTARQGQVLTEAHGTWTNSPSSYAYEWQACDSGGANCAAIAGATAQTYTLTVAEVGHTIRVRETASNVGGAGAPSTSAQTAVVKPAVPVSTAPPVIGGTARQGESLTEAHGSWTNAPTGYSYEWQSCDAAGASCTAIAGAAAQSYTVAASDAGHTIRVTETASNAGGAGAPAASAATSVVPSLEPAAVAPSNTALPAVSGSTVVGATLSTSPGAWSGTPPITLGYQWQRCAPSCLDVPRATDDSYTLVAADLGTMMRVLITAANSRGSASAASPTVGPVAPSAAMVKARLLQDIVPSGKAARIRTLVSRGGYASTPTALSAGRLTIGWYFVPKGAHMSKPKPVLIAKGEKTFGGPGTAQLKVKLSTKGRQALRNAKTLKLTGKAGFVAAGQPKVEALKTFTLKR